MPNRHATSALTSIELSMMVSLESVVPFDYDIHRISFQVLFGAKAKIIFATILLPICLARSNKVPLIYINYVFQKRRQVAWRVVQVCQNNRVDPYFVRLELYAIGYG